MTVHTDGWTPSKTPTPTHSVYGHDTMVGVLLLSEPGRSGCAKASTLSALILILPSTIIQTYTRGTSISVHRVSTLTASPDASTNEIFRYTEAGYFRLVLLMQRCFP